MADEKIMMLSMAVTEMAKAKEFYAEKLGWSIASEAGQGDRHWVTLALPGGGAVLTLTTMHQHMKPGTMNLYFSTSDIEATHNAFKAKGVAVSDVQDNLYGPGSGVKWFDFNDVDGNHWVAAQSEYGPQ